MHSTSALPGHKPQAVRVHALTDRLVVADVGLAHLLAAHVAAAVPVQLPAARQALRVVSAQVRAAAVAKTYAPDEVRALKPSEQTNPLVMLTCWPPYRYAAGIVVPATRSTTTR